MARLEGGIRVWAGLGRAAGWAWICRGGWWEGIGWFVEGCLRVLEGGEEGSKMVREGSGLGFDRSGSAAGGLFVKGCWRVSEGG